MIIGIVRYGNCLSVSSSVSADKEIVLIGAYRYQPIWKKANRLTTNRTEYWIYSGLFSIRFSSVFPEIPNRIFFIIIKQKKGKLNTWENLYFPLLWDYRSFSTYLVYSVFTCFDRTLNDKNVWTYQVLDQVSNTIASTYIFQIQSQGMKTSGKRLK